jgi:carboxyl-terminal processing protease
MAGHIDTRISDSDPAVDDRRRIRPGCARVAGAMSLAVAVLGLGAFGGIVFDRLWLTRFLPLPNMPSIATADFGLMAQAWNTIERYYVDRDAIKPRQMTYGAIAGMVYSLGDTGHSTFLSPRMVEVAASVESGRLQGIGIEVSMKNGHIEVVAPLDNSPAQRAGLRSGDVILDVNGRDASGQPLSEVVGWIAGPPGSKVTLRVLNPTLSRTRVVTLTRASIEVPGLTAQRLPGTQLLQLRIAQFGAGLTGELERHLKSLQAEPAQGLILDLRDDPGGLLDEAVGVASQFLASGNVLLEKDAQGHVTTVPVRPDGMALTVPLVVLINHGTGSAAEIVAAALKDADRAKLVGTTTFGTGTVLAEFPLSDGSAMLLAIREWLTPKGHVIWHKGVEPNIEVQLSADIAPLWPEAERMLDAKQLAHSDDRQLLRAIELLTPTSGSRPDASLR